jgi:hypothetical protein
LAGHRLPGRLPPAMIGIMTGMTIVAIIVAPAAASTAMIIISVWRLLRYHGSFFAIPVSVTRWFWVRSKKRGDCVGLGQPPDGKFQGQVREFQGQVR